MMMIVCVAMPLMKFGRKSRFSERNFRASLAANQPKACTILSPKTRTPADQRPTGVQSNATNMVSFQFPSARSTAPAARVDADFPHGCIKGAGVSGHHEENLPRTKRRGRAAQHHASFRVAALADEMSISVKTQPEASCRRALQLLRPIPTPNNGYFDQSGWTRRSTPWRRSAACLEETCKARSGLCATPLSV